VPCFGAFCDPQLRRFPFFSLTHKHGFSRSVELKQRCSLTALFAVVGTFPFR
jgi:hypothetical protein